MLCDNCHEREAAVHVQIFHDGQKETRSLCPVCAVQMQGNMMQALMALGRRMKTPPPDKPVLATCAYCGQTFTGLNADTRMGCPKCYEAVEALGAKKSELFSAYENQKKSSIGHWEHLLRESLVQENYERAAVIRDHLNRMKQADEGHEQ